jgi:hypothetical protein
MPFTDSGVAPNVYALKRVSGQYLPRLHSVSLDNCNQIDYKNSRMFAAYDPTLLSWSVLIIDVSQVI